MKTDTAAIIWGSRTIFQSRLEQYISAAIKHLKGRGIARQDRVVIVEPNSIEHIIILMSLWRMGAVACPVNPRWPLESVLASIQTLRPKLIITSQAQLLHSKRNGVATIVPSDIISFDARQQVETSSTDIPLDNLATIIWTSGSSASPKAAVHSWGNHFYNAKGSQEIIPLTHSDRWLLSLPLYHVSGISIICRCMLAGAAIVVSDDEHLLESIRRSKPSHVSLVPTQLYRLLEHKEDIDVLKTVRYILLGGSAIPASLLDKALFHDLNVYTSYGLTESASQVATGKLTDINRSHARVLPYRQLKIDSDGQILIRGEVLFKGYYHQDRITLPLNDDGWFKTKDLGKLDDHGHLTVLGRMDNMFISAGENIQPEEIEGVIMRLSDVRQAVVVAQEDAEYGHRPIAFIRTQGHFNPSLYMNHCVKYLPKIKVPVAFYPWPHELNQGIKISRKFFQERIGNL